MTLPFDPENAEHESTVFFDIDGTLLLTRKGRDAMSLAFEHHFNVEEAFSDVNFAGATDPVVVEKICSEHELSVAESDSAGFFDDYYQRLSYHLDGGVQILPGSHEILRVLRHRPVNLGLITGNNPGGAYAKLEHSGLLSYFEGGAYGSDGPQRSNIVRTALDRFKTSPSKSVMIGDSIHDVRTGKEHGLHTIAVHTGTTPKRILKKETPDLLLSSLAPPSTLLDYLDAHVLPTNT